MNETTYFKTSDLSVGYNGRMLIRDIELNIEKGSIVTLIGPNGSGKSTILKSITAQLAPIKGSAFIDKDDISKLSAKEMAKKVALVLTDRVRAELMSCAEVVALGRYPYTNFMGRLSEEDRRIVMHSLERVNALDLADKEFSSLSDGQRQRVILARAICQQPELIVLDEPTAYLDIRHKIELLGVLKSMARENGITVIMSLHEIDLAAKVSDSIVCVKGETIKAFGKPEEILKDSFVDELYSIDNGSYDTLFGSVELERVQGEPQVFVVAGNGRGISVFRELQKKSIPFAAGILFENDIDTRVAERLSEHVVTSKAFEPIDEAKFIEAKALIDKCASVIDAGAEIGQFNSYNAELLKYAKMRGLNVRNGV